MYVVILHLWPLLSILLTAVGGPIAQARIVKPQVLCIADSAPRVLIPLSGVSWVFCIRADGGC